LLKRTFGAGWRSRCGELFSRLDSKAVSAVEKMSEKGLNAPPTSSMGRLFDAVSFIAGLGPDSTYEGQGPMELESLFRRPSSAPYPFGMALSGGTLLIDPSAALAGALSERGAGRARRVSERFHTGLAEMLAEAVSRIGRSRGIRTAVLSGGVFQNRVLLELGKAALERKGFRVVSNEKVPANDGGIALGQVYYALNRFRRA
ncbi:MAG TPA: hypothetical protein PL037_07740, partial [Elusimicrobiales bacterium]|nr:hypothetical protein [Elusimicrobiales bacterium]